ncbi:hypothetical protein [Chitinophaga tropicalis]|uniref:Uncharacterized protein n=1 Tax=Chitinophaga tropicalis TaxID=2683588 RepID=A0A7K1UAH3_9BACT|nr:hypothetical protein [Chitinophaga tropicalis]MVT11343.1 hypothetical protein [Chitinophaga tropicalis]
MNSLSQTYSTAEKTLNGTTIQSADFYILLRRIIKEYPGCKVHDDGDKVIWMYPS